MAVDMNYLEISEFLMAQERDILTLWLTQLKEAAGKGIEALGDEKTRAFAMIA